MSSGFAENYRIFCGCGAPPCSNPLHRKTKEKAPSPGWIFVVRMKGFSRGLAKAPPGLWLRLRCAALFKTSSPQNQRKSSKPGLDFCGADEGIFPRASQSPTGALAAHCGAPPCSNPLHRKTKEKAPSLSLELFFGADEGI